MYTFKSEFIDGKKNILIPALQRDYVQGGRTDVINPFVDEILSVLRTEKRLDLNYIYGSYEDGYFVPIDGQQRLITLWLVYLYLFKKQKKDFQVKLKFNSREFANAFSEKLLDKVQDFINSTELKKDIIDSSWFISGWQYDVTVCNMLKTLDLLAKKSKGPNICEYKNYDNISFSFLDIENEGLTDDIYVKMNGRGKPLTYFENLKSWMDGKIIELFGKESNFTKRWQTNSDNEWTDFFWENRNKKQEHSEKIDDEQTRFFYSLLLVYWIKKEDTLLSNLSDDKINGLNAFIGLSEDNKEKRLIKNRILEILREGKTLIPLYWIEEIGLYDKDVFEFISESFANLCDLNSKKLLITISSPNKYLDLDVNEDDNSLLMYKLSMTNATYAKTLPYLYALIRTPELCKNEENFRRWIRLIRNLVVNSKIGKENFAKVCNCVDNICKFIKQDFYASVSNFSNLDGFEKAQLNEEIEKAKQIRNDDMKSLREYKGVCKNLSGVKYKTWEDIIIEAEQYSFFKGAIRFLFQNDNGNVDWNDFDEKFENAKKYFDENNISDKKTKEIFNYAHEEKYLLKAFINNFDEDKYFEKPFYYDSEKEHWRQILLEKKWAKPVNQLLTNFSAKTNIDFIEMTNLNPINKNIKKLCVSSKLLDKLPNGYFKKNEYLHQWYYWDDIRFAIPLTKIYEEIKAFGQIIKTINLAEPFGFTVIKGYDINFMYENYYFILRNESELILCKNENFNSRLVSESQKITTLNRINIENACLELIKKISNID